MGKTDICSAFRNVPVHPKDWELLGMHWNGLYFFDTVLPFGLRSAPYIFNQLSDAIQWIAKTNYDIRHILHILDDFFLIEPPPRANCMTSLCKLLAPSDCSVKNLCCVYISRIPRCASQLQKYDCLSASG